MPLPVISVAQMRDWESATWATGRKEAAVIARVGETVAERAKKMVRPGDLVLILAGKGHNGDDARAVRPHIPGWQVYLRNISDPETGIEEVYTLLDQKPALIIDGLFGIGLNRPLDAKWSALIRRINDLKTKVLAIDVPSGLSADSGEPQGAAIVATVTLTLGAPKLGLLLPQAEPYVGRLELAENIGLAPCLFSSKLNWTLPKDFDAFPPTREVAAHKGDFGHLAIIAGSMGYHGAAVLATRGAQRAQPGLVTLFPQENIYGPVASQLQAAMVSPWRANLKLPGPFSAILIGPGLAAHDLPEVMKKTVRQLWVDSQVPVIADASALDWLPPDSTRAGALRVITPHPGEAARLLKATPKDVQTRRAAAARELSKRFGDCWVVLKGSQTHIGCSAGEMFINPSGNPTMAQGGSGDVLAGYLAGLLAQPALQADPAKTLCYGVWQHGVAGDLLAETRPNWVIEDLVSIIGNPRVSDEKPAAPKAAETPDSRRS